MKAYYFKSESGSLYDTRDSKWAEKPLRPIFSQCRIYPKTGQDIRAAIRHGSFAWPGGYPIFARTADGGAICFDCLRKELRKFLEAMKNPQYGNAWLVSAFVINWEEHNLTCDNCGKAIESAYGKSEE